MLKLRQKVNNLDHKGTRHQPDLTELMDKWKNSAIDFHEVEVLINLLIVDNDRLEKEKTELQGWRAHIDVAVNCWEEGETPKQALEFAIKTWQQKRRNLC